MGIDSFATPPGSTASLADALFTGTQKRVLRLLFGQPGRSFYVTELIKLARAGRGGVQRELSRLERGRLIVPEWQGNRKHFRANAEAPIYQELCSIISKTVGVAEQIRAALGPIESRITLALIYGSVAKQTDTAASDIDLLIVSDDLTLEEVFSHLASAERELGRSIDPALYTRYEFDKRRQRGNEFLRRVLTGPTEVLAGSSDVKSISG